VGGGRYEPHKFELVLPAPAGSIGSSATDMAMFMLAHLGNGEYNGQRILAESTAVRMHTRTFTHDPRLPGFDLGFYEKSSHGLEIIGHGGDTGWFHSDLALIPGERLGVFVSYNTNTGGELSFGTFLREFLDHYYPITPPPPVPWPAPSSRRRSGRGVRVQPRVLHDVSARARPRRCDQRDRLETAVAWCSTRRSVTRTSCRLARCCIAM
jgi:CubicO group peptidase (beta-lactamase class C family)